MITKIFYRLVENQERITNNIDIILNTEMNIILFCIYAVSAVLSGIKYDMCCNNNLSFHLYFNYKLNLDHMRKREMTVWQRGQYLIIVYEFVSYKIVLQPYRQIVGRNRSRNRSCAARELQRITAVCNPSPMNYANPITVGFMVNHGGIEIIAKKLKLHCTHQKREQTESSRNFRCLKNKV